jgi:predicted NUDIX family NTP pyrophosphohydrolase
LISAHVCKKDVGAWSISKGEMDEGEDAEAAARREFMEETGIALSGLLDRSAKFASVAANG